MSGTNDTPSKGLDWADDRVSRLTYTGVVAMTVGLLVVLPLWYVLTAPAAAFQLHYNPFALLSAISAITALATFVLIIRIRQHSDTLMWFSAFLLGIISWAIGEIMVRLSATPAAALFWAPLSTPGSEFMSIALFMFALSYVNPRQALRPYLLPCLAAASSLFIYLDGHSSLITFYTVDSLRLRPWGYVPTNGEAYALIALWTTVPAAAAFLLLYRFRKYAIDPIIRQQTKLFLIAIAIPLVGGALTDGLLSALNIDVLPSLAVILLTIMSLIICYGIVKYRLFSFTPMLIADQILGTMNEAVIGIRPDFHISYVNRGAEQLFATPGTQLADMPLYMFFADQLATQAALRKRLSAALGSSNFAVIDALELQLPSKRPTTVKVSITKLDDKRQPYGYLVVMTDITELTNAAAMVEHQVQVRTHQLHEEQAKLKAAIEDLPLGFMFIDNKNHILVQNRALHSIFAQEKTAGFSVEQLQKLMPKVDVMTQLETVRHSGKPVEIREATMGERILHLYIAPVVTTEKGIDAATGCVILVQDITEEKVLARSKDEFFSIASHELRTPLTAIRGNTSIIMKYFQDVLSKEPTLPGMISDIHESSTRLIEIVNDFLDVSRIEQGKMSFSFESLDIGEIVRSVFAEMRIVADQKKLSLAFEEKTKPLPKVWADKNRLTQIVYNLVGNAVKFTEAGGITARASVEGDVVKLRIIDTGHGISRENQKLLFHKFQQASDSILTRDDTRGTGLGLYISSLIAKSMHGELVLEHSEPQKGSSFMITIPLAAKGQTSAIQRLR
ncbi:MAG TPA: ATP-binding protein [Candidatus Saccharimonadia bacterium]|nr:ATP-binding protein [Candidatus Saccharimonadia bacterium]